MASGGLDEFMATMVAQSPPLSSARALELARAAYGLDARATRLTGERDENFRLTVAAGTEYVLKVANPAQSAAVTALPVAALLHVEHRDPTLPCPRVVRSRTGSTEITFLEGGLPRTACVLTWLPGKLLASSRRSSRQRAACGRIGGRLCNALRGFEHPAAHRAIVWDVLQVGRLGGVLEQVAGFPARGEVVALLELLVPRVESAVPRLRQQIVHNDLNPLNVLVDPADEDCVTGIIDFGDITRTALVADVAVTAAEQIPEGTATDVSAACQAVREVAAAYHESVPLLQPELAILGTLVAARLATILVVHAWHLERNPHGGHYLEHDPQFIRARLQIARALVREELSL